MCQLLLSGVGYVPTPNVHSDVWDHVESYRVHMLLAHRLKITFTLSLKLIMSFLAQLQHLLFHSLIVTSSLVRVGTPLPLQSCCISGLREKDLLQNPDTCNCLPHTHQQHHNSGHCQQHNQRTMVKSNETAVFQVTQWQSPETLPFLLPTW
jgi:hypothetical protein